MRISLDCGPGGRTTSGRPAVFMAVRGMAASLLVLLVLGGFRPSPAHLVVAMLVAGVFVSEPRRVSRLGG